MIRASYILLILLAIAVTLSGQISPPVVVLSGSPPGGVGAACIVPVPLYANLTTGILASCVSSVWTAFSTGSFTYPGAGVAVSTGSGWGTSLSSSMTVNSQTCTLGSSCAIPLSAMNPQTSTYQVLPNDFNNYKTITVASGTFTVTLVDGGTQPSNGKYINIVNYGSGVVTIATNGQNLNGGSSSLALAASSALLPSSATVWSDGTNYFARTSVTNGLALTSNPLSQFASTTSSQFAGVLSDETGTAVVVFSANPVFNGNGGLSSGVGPGITANGTWITGGSATTTKPYILVEPAGTTSTGWSTGGTGVGINAASGFSGNLLDLQVAGVGKVAIDNVGRFWSAAISDKAITATPNYYLNSAGIELAASRLLCWTNSSDAYNGNCDGGFSRIASGVIGAGTGAAGSTAAQLAAAGFSSRGTTYTLSTNTCSGTSLTGGPTAGTFASGSTGACAVVVLMGNGMTAPNGWACSAVNRTTVANLYGQTASSTTTASMSGVTVSGDIISFSCIGY